MIVWGMVPARGGSKSIPRKNLVDLGGRPLLDYGVLAAKASNTMDRLIGSSDDESILRRFRDLDIEADRRPDELATDEAAVADVARELLQRLDKDGRAEILVLIQPTSPFLRSDDIHAALATLSANTEAQSVQTIAPCPHNHHAWNQRTVDDGMVRFVYREERQRAYRKQLKAKHCVFGNLVAVRTRALREGSGFFAEPSAAVLIEAPYDLDVDGLHDLVVAEALIASGEVELPHIPSNSSN